MVSVVLSGLSGHCGKSNLSKRVLRLVCERREVFESLLCGLLETTDNHGRVNTLSEKFLRLLHQFPCEDDGRSGSVVALCFLSLSHLDNHACGRVGDVDFAENRCTVVGDRDATVVADEHLVHSHWAEGRANKVRNLLCRDDIHFLGRDFTTLLLRIRNICHGIRRLRIGLKRNDAYDWSQLAFLVVVLNFQLDVKTRFVPKFQQFNRRLSLGKPKQGVFLWLAFWLQMARNRDRQRTF